MANKFTVFVVFAAVAQVSLASAAKGSSDLEAAQKATCAAWHQCADVVCKIIQDGSWPIEKARDEYRSYQVAGRTAFLNVTPYCDNPSMLIEIGAFGTAFRDGIFEAVWDARNCKNYTATKAAIENYKTEFPYEQIVRDLHKLTHDTGSQTIAVESLKLFSETTFADIEKLLEVTCGGQQTIGPCHTNEIYEQMDAYIKIIYSWLTEGSVYPHP